MFPLLEMSTYIIVLFLSSAVQYIHIHFELTIYFGNSFPCMPSFLKKAKNSMYSLWKKSRTGIARFLVQKHKNCTKAISCFIFIFKDFFPSCLLSMEKLQALMYMNTTLSILFKLNSSLILFK